MTGNEIAIGIFAASFAAMGISMWKAAQKEKHDQIKSQRLKFDGRDFKAGASEALSKQSIDGWQWQVAKESGALAALAGNSNKSYKVNLRHEWTGFIAYETEPPSNLLDAASLVAKTQDILNEAGKKAFFEELNDPNTSIMSLLNHIDKVANSYQGDEYLKDERIELLKERVCERAKTEVSPNECDSPKYYEPGNRARIRFDDEGPCVFIQSAKGADQAWESDWSRQNIKERPAADS